MLRQTKRQFEPARDLTMGPAFAGMTVAQASEAAVPATSLWVPAFAGMTASTSLWVPAFAGMTAAGSYTLGI